MGYDIHISHAAWWIFSEFLPIGKDAVIDLVRGEADLDFDPGPTPIEAAGSFYFSWYPAAGEGSWFHLADGQIHTKHPDDATLRRMLGMAAVLDAWVNGDDGEIYEVDSTGQIHSREPTGAELFSLHRIARHEHSWKHPLLDHREWLDLAASQPDFRIETQVEARLPSGRKPIPCPPVACWTGHPSGTPVPFFAETDESAVEAVAVLNPDPPTVERMTELANHLAAHVFPGG